MNYSDNQIHPTALIHGNVRMGKGNTIGPHVILDGDIDIGNHNIFGPGVFLENRVRMGDHNKLHAYVCLGGIGEMGAKGDRWTPEGGVDIGNHVTLREYVCIHSPVYHKTTRIHDHVYLMNKCYVAHDGEIGQGTVMSAGVALGGRCVVGERVNIGMGAVVHQQRVIGHGAMVGMGSVVTRDIFPYAKVAGNPVRILGFNHQAITPGTYDQQWIDEMMVFFESRILLDDPGENPLKQEVIDFFTLHPDSLLTIRHR